MMDNYRSSDNGSGASSYVIPGGRRSPKCNTGVIKFIIFQDFFDGHFLRSGIGMCARAGGYLYSFSSIVGARLPMAYILKSVLLASPLVLA